MRRLIIAGNWKMNNSLADSVVLATMIRNHMPVSAGFESVVCPPATYLYPLSEIIHDGIKHISLGAQNMYSEDKGAYTGEVSPLMIRDICRYVILGHSERREHCSETSELINDKIVAALKHKITPIVCVGEIKKKADSFKDAAKELKKDIKGINKSDYGKLVIAYEPVWAIGTGKAATPEYAAKVITLLREIVGNKTPILYGGSVDEKNIASFTHRAEIDGALVGGASLKAKEFLSICEEAIKLSLIHISEPTRPY
jgi:triosephosphate isomerase